MFEPPQYVFVSIFLYPLCRCLYIFVSLHDTYYRARVCQKQRKPSEPGLCFDLFRRVRGVSLEACFANWVRENFGHGNFYEAVAHAASEVPRGGPKLVGRAPDSRFVLGTFLLQGCVRNLLLRRAFELYKYKMI